MLNSKVCQWYAVSITRRPVAINAIATLTILLAVLVLVGWLPFLWGPPPFFLLSEPRLPLAKNFDNVLFYIALRSFEPFLIVPAVVIGAFTALRGNRNWWTRKANIILQIITIAVFLTPAAYVGIWYGLGTGADGIREVEVKLAFVVIGSITLYLLFRPEVRSYYRALVKPPAR